MKAYIRNTPTCAFDYPEEMQKILDYLNAHGTLRCAAKTVEREYREFSGHKYCAGWMSVNEELLKEFELWMTRVDI